MSREGGASLATVLALLEARGSFTLFARTVDKTAPPAVRAALHSAGIVRAAPAAPTWPCDERGCAREVRANHDGARKPLVAVCSRAPTECSPVELAFEDVAQQSVVASALVSTVCALLGTVPDRGAIARLDAVVPLGDVRRPILVATSDDPPRDVFWCPSPRDTDLDAFCARRERVSRGSLVLCPTGKHVPLEVAARFAAGEKVEVMALADVLEIRDGALALGVAREVVRTTLPPTAALVPLPPPVSITKRRAATGKGIAGELRVTNWEQLRIAVIDEQTVRIEGNGQSLLRSFVELGFVDGRRLGPGGAVVPVVGWGLFLILCREGAFRPATYAEKEMGKKWGAKQQVWKVREALKGAFGLEGDPFERYSKKEGWRTRFRKG